MNKQQKHLIASGDGQADYTDERGGCQAKLALPSKIAYDRASLAVNLSGGFMNILFPKAWILGVTGAVAQIATQATSPSRQAEERMPFYGGQAVIEGVLMRGRRAVAIAMRAPNGEIVIHTEPLSSIYQSRIAQTPFLRGLIGLWDALVLGVRALTLSANLQMEEDEQLEGLALYLTLGVSLAIGIGLFFLLPAAVGRWAEILWDWNAWGGNLLEGLFRLVLLVAYVGLIGLMPDVRRLYMYHGAEHKTINAFEAYAPLTPESVARYPKEHTRCGTAFLLILVLLSIVLFALLGPLPMLPRLLSRLLLLPVLAGLAYEYLRFTARHAQHPLIRRLIAPNLALQRLTTREPTSDMLEVAIAAFQTMLQAEKAAEVPQEPSSLPEPSTPSAG